MIPCSRGPSHMALHLHTFCGHSNRPPTHHVGIRFRTWSHVRVDQLHRCHLHKSRLWSKMAYSHTWDHAAQSRHKVCGFVQGRACHVELSSCRSCVVHVELSSWGRVMCTCRTVTREVTCVVHVEHCPHEVSVLSAHRTVLMRSYVHTSWLASILSCVIQDYNWHLPGSCVHVELAS